MSLCYNETEKLLRCLKTGVSPYHVVAHAAKQLDEAGFTCLETGKKWELETGRNYYTNVYGTTLFAFHIPENYHSSMPLYAASAHTDWPGPRIKSNPELTEGQYQKLNIEIYGGPIFYSWMDRPLSIAGAVCLREKHSVYPEIRLVDFKRPMAVIPSLAIHYNREVNSHLELNAQNDLSPLMDVLPPEWKHDGFFQRLLAEELGVEPKDILSWSMGFYNMDEPVLYGEHTELLSAPRLDNLTSVQGCISGMIEASDSDVFSAIMLFDNEEIGSSTKQGADSVLTAHLLEKVIESLGGTHADYVDSMMSGIMLSCDVSHAVHPNRAAINDPTNKNYLGDGIALKMNCRQSYATDIQAIAFAEDVCQKKNIPHKRFHNRTDVKGGSTLGCILSAQTCIRTVDLGVSILSMHSARELMASKDQTALCTFIASVLKGE